MGLLVSEVLEEWRSARCVGDCASYRTVMKASSMFETEERLLDMDGVPPGTERTQRALDLCISLARSAEAQIATRRRRRKVPEEAD